LLARRPGTAQSLRSRLRCLWFRQR
jgi:hypothetical protein